MSCSTFVSLTVVRLRLEYARKRAGGTECGYVCWRKGCVPATGCVAERGGGLGVRVMFVVFDTF